MQLDARALAACALDAPEDPLERARAFLRGGPDSAAAHARDHAYAEEVERDWKLQAAALREESAEVTLGALACVAFEGIISSVFGCFMW